jgi:ADP-ribose pyrophosphatase YjhB (NUDIX family)
MSESRRAWNGSAGIILAEGKMLMVKEKESMGWSIPSGGIENDESPEQACIREIWEETGFKTEVKKPLQVKEAIIKNYDVTTHYFLCEVIGGQISFHDPDDSIEEIAWKTYEEVLELQHDYPEDQEMLLSFFENNPLKV